MSITMFQASVPVFLRGLDNLSALLAKAETHAAARKIDAAALLTARLYPDMFALTRQVQIAADFGKGVPARLAGLEPPKWEDNETSFADLQARVARTKDYVRGFSAAQIDGSEDRDITLMVGGSPMTLKGLAYLTGFGLPNFYFHAAAAYAILRHSGVEIGKRDFIGSV